jgi:methanogenic corrinoid protein MtbC1
MRNILNDLDRLLSKLDDKTILSYEQDLDSICSGVIKNIENLANINNIINNYPISFIKPIIINHLYLVKESLVSKNSQKLLNHIFWALKSYNNMTKPYVFFKYLFEAIITEIENKANDLYRPIIDIYKYLLKRFEDLIIYAKQFKDREKDSNYSGVYEEFMKALLTPNMGKSIDISNDFIKNRDDIKIFWEQILVPALYNIGSQWSNGKITVGQEHTATSICQRVMALHYDKILGDIQNKKKILVTPSPTELHQIGARMVSDFLELNGYEVFYICPKSITSDYIIKIIIDEDIEDIIISTTLISNLDSTRVLISQIKKQKKVKVYVGGQAYTSDKQTAESVNADFYISSIDKLLEILAKS